MSTTMVDQLQKELSELKRKFEQQRRELIVAQEKRSGHYKKLEYQIERNQRLEAQIRELEQSLDDKNKGFLRDLILEKYPFLDKDTLGFVDRFNEELLSNYQLKKLNHQLFEDKQRLEIELLKLKEQFNNLQKEAIIAQEKRSGHYKKLVRANEQNEYLEAQIIKLKRALENNKHSLTWLLGEALLQCKTISGLIRFPINVIQARKKFIAYRKQLEKEDIVQNLVTNQKEIENKNNISDTKTQNVESIIDIGILGWPKPTCDKPITIMSIADIFTTSNLKSVANLITPRPDNWKGLLNRDKPALLFVESAWNGNQNSWQYRVGSYANPPGKELFEAIAEFKKQNLPTVFWNKEDPVHFDKFKNSAKEFDYIFTSDEGSIPAYQKISNAKVFALPFAADSSVNNPIGSTERQEKVCFAGSYYANRFIERRNDQLMLLESALPYGLDIYDRNAGNANKDFHFPEQFSDCIRGSLPYEKMNMAYKQYKLFLNVNSVIDSKTMFSRRVFELLASGTPIVSTPSVGIDEFFGQDLVWTVKNKQEAQEAIHTLLNNQVEWRKRSLKGIRKVFTEHTFQDRFDSILKIVGINNAVDRLPQILCCIEVNEQPDIDTLKQVIKDQYTANKFELVPFVIIRNKKLRTDLPHIVNKDLPVFELLERHLQQHQAVRFISLFASKNLYGKYYLLDLYLATLYAKAQIISKPEQDSYSYSNSFIMTSSLIDRDVLTADKGILSVQGGQTPIKTSSTVFLSDAANFAYGHKNSNNLLSKIEI